MPTAATRIGDARLKVARRIHAARAVLRRRLRNFCRSLTTILPVAPDDLPRLAAHAWLQGRGIEIGALHHPMRLPPGASVRYVDRMNSADLRRHYPTLANKRIVEVDIVDDAERLAAFPDASEGFIIANHLLEHCQDAIGTLKNMFRVLRPGGVLFLTLPDKRETFDRDRPVTSLAHLREDHERGPKQSRRQHYEEWVRLVEQVAGETEIHQRVQDLMSRDHSIHFHVWTFREMLEMLLSLSEEIGFEIMSATNREKEAAFVLRRAFIR